MLVLATFFPTSETTADSLDVIAVSRVSQLLSSRVFHWCSYTCRNHIFIEFISMITLICTLQEFLKSTVDVADLFGLYLTMTKIPGKGELKVLVAGLGKVFFKVYTCIQYTVLYIFCKSIDNCLCICRIFILTYKYENCLVMVFCRLGNSRARYDKTSSIMGWCKRC